MTEVALFLIGVAVFLALFTGAFCFMGWADRYLNRRRKHRGSI